MEVKVCAFTDVCHLLASTNRLGCAFAHAFGSILDGPYDILVAGAAADVAFKPCADLSFGWVRIVFEQLVGSHNHARGAETTLQAVFFPETFL